jgi:N-acetylglucosamine kinase-like BadF-type ATPase
MILIADGGSTKTSWCLVNNEGRETYFETEGYNPYFVNSSYILRSLHESLPPHLKADKVTSVSFYGAGCGSEKDSVVMEALQVVFANARVEVAMDLVAAARALLGSTAGFAAILGTGTNTCLYDGREIIQNIDSLGFILGDEGSGGAMGKRFLGDYIRGLLPQELSEIFVKTYDLSPAEIIDQIYSKPMANRFCAGFSKFIYDHLEFDYATNLVRSNFDTFFSSLVSKYPDYTSYSFNCIGSVGFSFRPILEKSAASFGMPVGRVLKSPMPGLVSYHMELAGCHQ